MKTNNRIKTNKIHPYARRVQQCRKKLMRSCGSRKVPHHSRKWWKAWEKTWDATHPVEGGEE